MFEKTARGLALMKVHDRARENASLLKPAINRLKLSASEASFIQTALTASRIRGRLALSNPHVRRRAQEALIDALIAFQSGQLNLKPYFITFCWDEGFTWERSPDVDLNAMQRRVDKAVRRAGWEGVFVFDVDGFRPIAGEPGKRICFHVHGVCFRGEHGVGVRTFRQAMKRTSSFPNNLSAQAVKIKKLTLSPFDFARVGGYMLKPQTCEKNLVPSRRYPDLFRMRKTRTGFTSASALRLSEIWSYITAYDVIFSVGRGGKKIASDYRATLREFEREMSGSNRCRTMPGHKSTTRAWAGIRSVNGTKKYLLVRIATRSNPKR